MLQIKAIILQRLCDIQLLMQQLQSSMKKNRTTRIYEQSIKFEDNINVEHQYRSKQNQRLEKQIKCIKNMEQNVNIIDVYYLCLEVINKFDPQIKFVKTDFRNIQIIEYDLRKKLMNFLQKFPAQKNTLMINALSQPKKQIVPSQYLIWLSEWSRNTFNNTSRKFQEKRKGIISKDILSPTKIKECTSSPPRKIKTQAQQVQYIFFISKSHMHSFFKNELMAYYSLRSCMDLDSQYAQKLSRNDNKLKQEHLKSIIKYSKDICNNQTILSIQKYTQQYNEKIRQKRIIKSSLRQTQKSPSPQYMKSMNKKTYTQPSQDDSYRHRNKSNRQLKWFKQSSQKNSEVVLNTKKKQQINIFNFIKRNRSKNVSRAYNKLDIKKLYSDYKSSIRIQPQTNHKYDSPLSTQLLHIVNMDKNDQEEYKYKLRPKMSMKTQHQYYDKNDVISSKKYSHNLYRQNWSKLKRNLHNTTNMI